MGKVWMIASGKGGVGKSTISAALAVSLARHKRRVCVIDADVGLKGIDLMLGMENRTVFDLFDVSSGDAKLNDALVRHSDYPQLCLLSTSQAEKPDAMTKEQLQKVLTSLKRQFDFVLIDCPAGIGSAVTLAGELADSCILVVTPDDMSIRDAERASSVLFENRQLEMYLTVNRVDEKLIYDSLIMQPSQIADALGVPLIGEVPANPLIYRALLSHKSAAETDDKQLTKAIECIALRMEGGHAPFKTYRVRRKKWFHRAKG